MDFILVTLDVAGFDSAVLMESPVKFNTHGRGKFRLWQITLHVLCPNKHVIRYLKIEPFLKHSLFYLRELCIKEHSTTVG
jgi:hypothetical protein